MTFVIVVGYVLYNFNFSSSIGPEVSVWRVSKKHEFWTSSFEAPILWCFQGLQEGEQANLKSYS